MMRQKPILAGIALCAIAAWLAGCETDEPTSGLMITPPSAIVDASTTNLVAFTASGGDGNYYWSLGNTTLGILISSASNNTVYYQNYLSAGTNSLTVTDMDSSQANPTNAVIIQQ